MPGDHHVQLQMVVGGCEHEYWVVWEWQCCGAGAFSGDGHGIGTGLISPMSVVHARG